MKKITLIFQPEFFDVNQTIKFKQSEFNKLNTKQKSLCDYLKLI